MKRKVPWKGLIFGMAALFLLVVFYIEYFAIAVFFTVPFALAFGKLGYDLWRDRRRARRQEEDRLDAERLCRENRRAGLREARYPPQDRAAAEACLVQALGPVLRWDRQTGQGAPDIDVAFFHPPGSGWRAVTLGAGAVRGEGGRTELALLLPEGEAEDWAAQVLREAAQALLLAGGICPGKTCRGFHMTAAGFAGALAAERCQGLPGTPEPGSVTLPSGEGLWFCWLVPLLKPEWDYLQARGPACLFRRMSGKPVAADPGRSPWADRDWFAEDIAPFVWSESGGRFCLGLEAGAFCQEWFLRAGLTGSGWDWERLVREYVRRRHPEDGPFLEYACEDGVFFAAAEDEELLRRLALELGDLTRYRPEAILAMLAPEGADQKGAFFSS